MVAILAGTPEALAKVKFIGGKERQGYVYVDRLRKIKRLPNVWRISRVWARKGDKVLVSFKEAPASVKEWVKEDDIDLGHDLKHSSKASIKP